MSRVTDLREKIKKERSKSASEGPLERQLATVQEQLRGDHIETLEVLQAVVDENETLRKTVQLLKKKISTLGGTSDEHDMVDNDDGGGSGRGTDDDSDSSFLIAQIGLKDKELATVKGKLKAAAIEIKDLKELVDHLHKRDQTGSSKVPNNFLPVAL
jgi:hypothetical protein